MVKLIVIVLLLAVALLGAVLLVQDDPGFVLIKYADFSIETSLAFAIVLVFAAMLVIYIAIKIIRSIWRLPDSVKRQSQNRRFGKSRKLLNQGLIDLAEGKFSQAETNLIKLVDYSESPLLHYLAAARAAQLQGKYDARDSYLKSRARSPTRSRNRHWCNPGRAATSASANRAVAGNFDTFAHNCTATRLYSNATRTGLS